MEKIQIGIRSDMHTDIHGVLVDLLNYNLGHLMGFSFITLDINYQLKQEVSKREASKFSAQRLPLV